MIIANNTNTPINGPIYWLRIISFIAGATIRFNRGQVINVTVLHGWVAGPECKGRGWDTVELGGTIVVEYSNIETEPFGGLIANQGSNVDVNNFAIVTISDSPAANPVLSTKRAYSAGTEGQGGAVPATGVSLFCINGAGAVGRTKINRMTIAYPGKVTVGGMAFFMLRRSGTAGSGGTAITIATRSADGNIPAISALLNPAGLTLASRCTSVIPLFIPPNDGPFVPIRYDFDGIILPMIEMDAVSNTAIVLHCISVPAGHDGNFNAFFDYTVE